MTKSELVSRLSERYPEFGKRLMEDAVSLFFSEISTALQRGQRVEIRGFGSFSLRKREGRVGRNPKTGDTVVVSGKWTPFFKAGKELRTMTNEASEKNAPNRLVRSSRQRLDAIHTQPANSGLF